MKMRLKKGDRVQVIQGKDIGKVGDKERVQETRPLSKLKRWRIVDVLEWVR